jgi:SAM-dependent methyltransferase
MYKELNKIFRQSNVLLALLRATRQVAWKNIRSLIIKSYIGSQKIRKIQLGSSSHLLETWLTTDYFPNHKMGVIILDAAKTFAFKSCFFDYAFSEHQIEHISYRESWFMLSECFRILKQGGRIRMVLEGKRPDEKSM